MSIRKYIAYLRTVETGSITQAANELGYTQSAVSKMISDLEQDWQVKLLTRNHSGIEISSDGMVLLPTIREIVKDYEDLNFAVSELHGVCLLYTSSTTRWSPFSQRINQWRTRPASRSSSCRTRTSCA